VYKLMFLLESVYIVHQIYCKKCRNVGHKKYLFKNEKSDISNFHFFYPYLVNYIIFDRNYS